MPRIFKFLDHLKGDLDVARDFGVATWGDFMILACDADR